FEAMGWQYLFIEDGNDIESINKAINKAKKNTDQPSLIEIRTIIGYGTSVSGTSKVHGAPIGNDEANKLRENLQWEYEPFEIPKEIYDHYKLKVASRGKRTYNKWHKLIEDYKNDFPNEYAMYKQFHKGITVDYDEMIKQLSSPKDATRNSSGKIIDYLSKKHLNFIGGSADLTASTKAKGADGHYDKNNRLARNINFGVREHAMGAIVNGMTLHGGLKVFGGAFFVFSDYMKPAIRLAAIMQIPSIFVFSHDTIAVGEDGPTHQPIEQLTGLRAIPNLNVIRPADAHETAAAWKIAMESISTPTVIILTRQNVTNQNHTSYDGLIQGAYIVEKEHKKLDGILLASGSEVGLAIDVKNILFNEGVDVRVVSMPSHYLYEKQTLKYKKQILPKRVKTVAIEMGSSMSWYKYTNEVIGIDTFGVSAPLEDVLEYFGFTPEQIAKKYLGKNKKK
ncbi:MAG: transketolase, partial [Bacillota bacterium]